MKPFFFPFVYLLIFFLGAVQPSSLLLLKTKEKERENINELFEIKNIQYDLENKRKDLVILFSPVGPPCLYSR